MNKLEVTLTNEELRIIKHEMKKNPNEKVRNKAKVLYLRYSGYTEREIVNKADVSLCTALTYIKAFIKDGLNSIYTTGYKGQPSKLNKYKDEIIEEFKKNPPSTRAEAVAKVKELWNIDTSITAIGMFLKKTECPIKKQGTSLQKQIKKNNKSSWMFN